MLRDWLAARFPHSKVDAVNGAVPASGSDYFSFCMKLHIPEDADLVVVELGVNDEALPEHEVNMENLLRGLLDLPNQPAVMLLEVVAFSQGEMAGGGYRKHLPIAQYYGELFLILIKADPQTFPSSSELSAPIPANLQPTTPARNALVALPRAAAVVLHREVSLRLML